MKTLGYLALCALLVVAVGCTTEDPDENELLTGKNIDIARMQGSVIAKDTRYFTGNLGHTKEDKGKPYYCVTIQTTSEGSRHATEFCGVPVTVFDSVVVGQNLSEPGILTEQQLANIHGTIVDKVPWPASGAYFVVVDDGRSIRSYRVAPEIYYRALAVGNQLPLVQ